MLGKSNEHDAAVGGRAEGRSVEARKGGRLEDHLVLRDGLADFLHGRFGPLQRGSGR